MFKQVVLGIIAASALAMLWTEASAQSCVTWRRVGGSNVCTKWSTKGVLVELKLQQDCGPDGSLCEAFVEVESTNSIAFCQAPNGSIRKAACTDLVTFSGQADVCEPKHEKDNDTVPGGGGHDKNHSCTSTTAFTMPDNPLSCQTSCIVGETLVDVTPIVMDTLVSLFVGGGGDFLVAAQAQPPSEECPPGSSFCSIEEHCTIDPKKIQFNAIRPYQCEVTDVFSGEGA